MCLSKGKVVPSVQAIAGELAVARVEEHLGRSVGREGVVSDCDVALDLQSLAQAHREATVQPAEVLTRAGVDDHLRGR